MSKIATLLSDPGKALASKYRDLHNALIRYCREDRVNRLLPDKMALSVKYEWIFGKKPDWAHPQTFNEKLQWLKLHYRLPIMCVMADKFAAKDYIRQAVGDEVVIPTIAVWDSEKKIDPAVLPDKFVLKCTHDSHSVIVCKNKESFDFDEAKKSLGKALRQNYYYVAREWPYKHVKPRIIAEQCLEDPASDGLLDYKFYMFHGEFKLMSITERVGTQARYIDFFDRDFRPLDMTWDCPSSGKHRDMPENLSYMLQLAGKLSRDVPFVRVDMYEVNNRVYVGELTLFDGAGFDKMDPPHWDKQLGDWLDLSTLTAKSRSIN